MGGEVSLTFFDPTTALSPPDAISYFDGACEPVNPGGTGGWGFIIRDFTGAILKEGHGRIAASPDVTNNVAEYVAAGKALQAYIALNRPGPFLLRGDSKLVVMQMQGAWQARQGAYIKVLEKVRALAATCTFEIRWEWVPREQNARADALSKLSLEEIGITPAVRKR